ncbi:MAG: type II toxin-antitoxin system VapC family toxin [Candidatus Micrarchaeota archaeon]|nr:type II toxin-antitoxin system VapC family toxin [Candidatus Micrarchaeota archaeon]
MVCLDTSTAIDFLSGHKASVELINSYEAKGETLTTTVVTVHELLKTAAEKKRVEIETFLDKFYIYPMTENAARQSAQLYRSLEASGKMINEMDILITGIAMANNESLVASDKDFRSTGYDRLRIIEK